MKDTNTNRLTWLLAASTALSKPSSAETDESSGLKKSLRGGGESEAMVVEESCSF